MLFRKCGKKVHNIELCLSYLKFPYCGEIGHPEILCLNKLFYYFVKRKHLKTQCP